MIRYEILEKIEEMLTHLKAKKDHLKTLIATGYSDLLIKPDGTLVLNFDDYDTLLDFITDEVHVKTWECDKRIYYSWKNDDHELLYSCAVDGS